MDWYCRSWVLNALESLRTCEGDIFLQISVWGRVCRESIYRRYVCILVGIYIYTYIYIYIYIYMYIYIYIYI